ncbi:hypothetical protein Vadar_011958 [Vaccinium darrowii]|uniref:Uncharacterized protein n=1 Tax=Vaccinium darrowii TaxID=229202 RepID=A0ACB7Z421_9ERIC|nr:hypothetical protein Vadar_011958 [Vaccinium darrowii]
MSMGKCWKVEYFQDKTPIGSEKIEASGCRAMVGQVAGGGRTEKPLLKAGNAFHKFRVKRNSWPKVRGVAMNPVDHPHGGDKSAGAKTGLIAARQTGRRDRGVKVRGVKADKSA